MRIFLIILAAIGVIALISYFGFDCGRNGTTTKVTVTTATSTTNSEAARRRAAERAGSGGAAVQDGPGSASAEPTGAPGTAGIDPNDTSGQLSLVHPFADTSPWNTSVLGQPTDENSDTFMRLANQRVGLVEKGNAPPQRTTITNRAGVFINTDRWSIPIVTTASGTPTRLVCRQLPPYCGDGANVPSLPIPTNASPNPSYDGAFVVEDAGNGVAYAMWRARRVGDVISYQFLRKWTLNGSGYQVPNSVSTIGSGLPSFAGVLLPEEIKAGRIEHALAIALPGPARDKYVQPASATDGVGPTNSIPEGARMRLKPGVRTPRLLPRTNVVAQRAIMKALRTYGAIVVERSRVPSLYAKMNYNWLQPMKGANGRYLAPNGRLLPKLLNKRANATPMLRGNEVQGLHLSDFEVVEITGPTFTFPALNSTEAAARSTATGGTG